MFAEQLGLCAIQFEWAVSSRGPLCTETLGQNLELITRHPCDLC